MRLVAIVLLVLHLQGQQITRCMWKYPEDPRNLCATWYEVYLPAVYKGGSK